MAETSKPLPQCLSVPHLDMPPHHDVRSENISLRRLLRPLLRVVPKTSLSFFLTQVGARTILALAMVAEVLHEAPYKFSDPARFSLALGGKNRHPFCTH